MEGNIEALPGILIRLGFKVLACPDHAEKEDMSVTLYGHKTGIMVTMEEPDKDKIIKTLKGANPVTGNATPKEASDMMYEAMILRDAR